MVFNAASKIAPEAMYIPSQGVLKEEVAVAVKEGMSDPKHVKRWAARGRLAGREAK
jgi:hypothetical protein